MRSTAAKTIAPRRGTALAPSKLVWLGGFSRAQAGINAWTPDGPYGGSVFALAIDPRTPSTLYAGIPRAGVFKSTDGGGSWWTANTGLTDTNVRALAIDPVTPTTLYAGTGHGVFALQQTTSGSR